MNKNKEIYFVGDLVMANRKYNYEHVQYEWANVFECPKEYALITKIVNFTLYKKYYIKFIDGSEDYVDADEISLIASCEKNSRELAAAASPGDQ